MLTRLLVPYKRVLSSAASKLSMRREIGKGGSVVLQKIRYLSCWRAAVVVSQIKTLAFHYIHLLRLLASNTRQGQKALPEWPGNGCGGEEAAWLQVGERNSRKRFLPRKKPLMNSSSGNGFNGSLGRTGSQPSTYLCTCTDPPLSTKFKVKCFLWTFERAACWCWWRKSLTISSQQCDMRLLAHVTLLDEMRLSFLSLSPLLIQTRIQEQHDY